MHRIVSFAPPPAEVIAALLQTRGVTDIEVISVHGKPREEILSMVARADLILGDYTFQHAIDREIVAAARTVKLIQQPSVGYQHIDIAACRAAGIRVANAAGGNTIAVAEHTVMVAMCLLKNIFYAARTTAQGAWNQMEVRPVELSGKTWGIVGMGRIGQAVAARVIPFGMTVIYYDPYRLPPEREQSLGVTYVPLMDLLKAADVLSLHCPLTDETAGLIGREALAVMKPTAVIVNVARGEVVDEEALALALKEGRIGGAALDVFIGEPITPGNPLLAVAGDKVILTPHVAGVTMESQLRIITMTVENLAAVIAGREPINLVT